MPTSPNITFNPDEIWSGSDDLCVAFLSDIYPKLAALVADPVYYLMLLYWAFMLMAFFGGRVSLTPADFLKKILLSFIILFMLAPGWNNTLAEHAYKMLVEIMNVTTGNITGGPDTVTLISGIHKGAGNVADYLMGQDIWKMGLILKGFLCLVVNTLFFIIAFFFVLIAKVGLAIMMAIGPLFIGFLLFQSTRQWFYNWVSQLLNFVFMYILIIAIIMFGYKAFGSVMDNIRAISSPIDLVIVSSQIDYLMMIEIILLMFLLGVKSWAAALSGGVASHGGAALLLVAGMAAKGFKAMAAAGRSPPAPRGGSGSGGNQRRS
jgi:type IV secretion system protein VirB6